MPIIIYYAFRIETQAPTEISPSKLAFLVKVKEEFEDSEPTRYYSTRDKTINQWVKAKGPAHSRSKPRYIYFWQIY